MPPNPEDSKMRAWEILENRNPPSKAITLRALHKMKLEAQAKAREEQERFALMPLIYGDLDRKRKMLELAQLRAEIAATEAETAAKSAMVIHKNAKSGIAATQIHQDHITKLAKNGLGRKLKA
jgi:hypothetical protein